MRTIISFIVGALFGIPILKFAWAFLQAHSSQILSTTNSTAIITHVANIAGQALK